MTLFCPKKHELYSPLLCATYTNYKPFLMFIWHETSFCEPNHENYTPVQSKVDFFFWIYIKVNLKPIQWNSLPAFDHLNSSIAYAFDSEVTKIENLVVWILLFSTFTPMGTENWELRLLEQLFLELAWSKTNSLLLYSPNMCQEWYKA